MREQKALAAGIFLQRLGGNASRDVQMELKVNES